MLIISFAWTVPALLALRKRCTRRHWNDQYARRWKDDTLAAAYDRLPRVGGHQLGVIRLAMDAYQERTSKFGGGWYDDYENEGFRYMEEQGLLIRGQTPREFCQEWINANELVWVVRFHIVELDTSRLDEYLEKAKNDTKVKK